MKSSDFLAKLEPFLRSPQSRPQTCQAILALARKDGCDCHQILQKTISILAQNPDIDFAPLVIAQAARELFLASPDSGIDVLRSQTFQTAYAVIKRTLLNPRAPLPTLLPDIFRFFHLSLWAAHNVELEETAVIAELAPILMAFSKSQVITVRCLAVAALLALEPLDGLYDRARYMVTGLDEHRQPVRHERLEKVFSSLAWEDLDSHPFQAFLSACISDSEEVAAISEHYRGPETDWRALALSVADTVRQSGFPTKGSGDVSMSNTSGEGLPYLTEITPALMAALNDGSDPEAASIIRLLDCMLNGNLTDLWAQARRAVEQHPTSAYARCVLSLLPDWIQGLSAAKQGLLCLDRDVIHSSNLPHTLRDWLWRRASVQAWEAALFLISQADLSSNGPVAQLVAAFVASAHHDLESILYAKQKEEDIDALPDKSPELLVWYVLLSVVLFGTQIPQDTMVSAENSVCVAAPYADVFAGWHSETGHLHGALRAGLVAAVHVVQRRHFSPVPRALD